MSATRRADDFKSISDMLTDWTDGGVEPDRLVPVRLQDLLDLHHKLESQPVIEEAKGILIGYYGLSADTAFGVLRRWSQNANVKLRTLAETLVAAATDHSCRDTSPEELIRHLLTSLNNSSVQATPSSGAPTASVTSSGHTRPAGSTAAQPGRPSSRESTRPLRRPIADPTRRQADTREWGPRKADLA